MHPTALWSFGSVWTPVKLRARWMSSAWWPSGWCDDSNLTSPNWGLAGNGVSALATLLTIDGNRRDAADDGLTGAQNIPCASPHVTRTAKEANGLAKYCVVLFSHRIYVPSWIWLNCCVAFLWLSDWSCLQHTLPVHVSLPEFLLNYRLDGYSGPCIVRPPWVAVMKQSVIGGEVSCQGALSSNCVFYCCIV